MIRRMTLVALAAAAVIVGGLTLTTQHTAAQSIPIGGGPCRPGWTCDCNSQVIPNLHCIRGDGTQGQVVVTVCEKCPPPDCEPNGACRLQLCEFSVTAACR